MTLITIITKAINIIDEYNKIFSLLKIYLIAYFRANSMQKQQKITKKLNTKIFSFNFSLFSQV